MLKTALKCIKKSIINAANENTEFLFYKSSSAGLQEIDDVKKALLSCDPYLVDPLYILLPTYVARSSANDQIKHFVSFVNQISGEAPTENIFVIVAMQWTNTVELASAQNRLSAILSGASVSANIRLFGFTLRASRKVDSINALVPFIPESTKHIGWFDDDVILAGGSIKSLIDKAKSLNDSVIGASKIGLCRNDSASRIVFQMKALISPAINYPHGCAIILPFRSIKHGIPKEISCDDGYICYMFMSPGSANPFSKLVIDNDAICYHKVGAGGGFKRNALRIRRLLIHHWQLMAFFPDKAVCYFNKSLFPDLWPINTFSCKRSVLVMGAKYFYFSLFLFVGLELLLRGCLKTPIKNYAWISGE